MIMNFKPLILHFFLNQAGLESAAQVRDMAHGPLIEFSFPIQCNKISAIFTENIGTLYLGKCVSFKCCLNFNILRIIEIPLLINT